MNPTDWLSHIVGDGFGAAVDNLLLTAMDGEEHTKYRKTLQKPFMRGQIRKLMDTLIRPVVVNEFINELRPKGKADLLREFALPFPIRAMYAYFGFPHDEDLLGKPRQLGDQGRRRPADRSRDRQDHHPAVDGRRPVDVRHAAADYPGLSRAR